MDLDSEACQDLGLARRPQRAVGRLDYVQCANAFAGGVQG